MVSSAWLFQCDGGGMWVQLLMLLGEPWGRSMSSSGRLLRLIWWILKAHHTILLVHKFHYYLSPLSSSCGSSTGATCSWKKKAVVKKYIITKTFNPLVLWYFIVLQLSLWFKVSCCSYFMQSGRSRLKWNYNGIELITTPYQKVFIKWFCYLGIIVTRVNKNCFYRNLL